MRKLALILTIMLLVTSCLGCGFTALADTNASKFDGTDVLEDLNGSIIAGQAFDLNNFVYTLEREAQIITFAEFGYHYDGSKQSNYALYVYVYNPSGKEIQAERNTVSLATVYEDGKATDYDKFTLRLLDVSDGKHANLFYKFKIADVSKILARVSANSNMRRYDVAEIELNYGAETSEAFDVGNYYEYSGFAKGYGADSKAESTLACTTDNIDTLRLDVKNTYYRYFDNVNTYDLSSVYFGVPKEVFSKYGKLQQIKANWFETHTSAQFVFTDKTMYEHCKQYPNTRFNDMPTINIGDRAVQKLWRKNGGDWFSVSDIPMAWTLYDRLGKVTSEEVASYAKDYSKRVGGELLIGKYSKDLFVSSVDGGRQYGWQGDDGNGIVIDADSAFDLNQFDIGDKFLNWFITIWSGGYVSEDIKDIEPIYIVKESDIAGTDAEVSKRLLILEKDVDKFKETYRNNQTEGKQTVLFRFATTLYTIDEMVADLHQGDFEIPALHSKDVGYISQQTVFLDFDVIWLKFLNAGQTTVIPCVSSPIDVFSGLTPPLKSQIPWWVWLIIACIVLLALILLTIWVKPVATFFVAVFKGLWYAIKYLFIGLHYVIASPVYLIAWIVEKARERRGG